MSKRKGTNALKHCRLCSFRTRSIKLIGAHYRKKHPGAMRRKKTAPSASRGSKRARRAVINVPDGAMRGNYDLQGAIQEVQRAGGHVTF